METITRERFNQLYKNHIDFLTGEFDQYDAMQHGNFSGLIFKNFDLSGLNISNANFRNTVFENCVMMCGTFKDCCFDGCTFKHVNANSAIFDNSTFRHVAFGCYENLYNEFMGASFHNCSFEGANIKKTYFSNSSFKGSEIISSLIEECSFDMACLDEVRFDISNRNNLWHTTIRGCSFNDTSIDGVENMEHIDLHTCSFNGYTSMGMEGIKFINKKLFRKIMWKRFIDRLFHKVKKPSMPKDYFSKTNFDEEGYESE